MNSFRKGLDALLKLDREQLEKALQGSTPGYESSEVNRCRMMIDRTEFLIQWYDEDHNDNGGTR